jgi:hypothetical protein
MKWHCKIRCIYMLTSNPSIKRDALKRTPLCQTLATSRSLFMPIEVLSALIGLGGALVGAIIQWLVARSTIRAETERLHRQLANEFRLQQFSEWQTEFRSVMSELLALTDPEAHPSPPKERIVPLVLKAQLMLNLKMPSHAKVNGLINSLALTINGWHGSQDVSSLLRTHGELLEASRETLFLPGR